MKTNITKWRLGAALLALIGLATQARATNPAYLNIDVTIVTSKSVQVNGVDSSTDATTSWSGTPNLAVNPVSTVTVTNNSGVLSEGWELSTNANSLPLTGAQSWTRVSSTETVGADEFGVQAVFGSSMTASCAAASWADGTIAPPLTTTPTQYTTTAFADSALAADGPATYQPDSGNLLYAHNATTGVGKRALCWRVILPATTATTNAQNIQIIVTAL